MTFQLNKAAVIAVNIFLVFLSGLLLILTSPGIDAHFIAWVALVPLFIVILHSGYQRAFFASMTAGIIFFFGLLWWALRVDGVNVSHFIPFILVNSSYFGVFGIVACYFQKRNPKWNFLFFPAAWTLLEYLHSHIGFLSFPWGILGYSQYMALSVAYVSAFTGVYGVSFLIVMVNILLSSLLLSYLSHLTPGIFRKPPSLIRHSGRMSSNVLICMMILFLLLVVKGFRSLPEKDGLSVLKAAIMQGNVFDDSNKDDHFRELALQKYYDLTLQAEGLKPDLIVWPESSVPGKIPYDQILVGSLSGLAQKTETFLLVGSSAYDKFSRTVNKKKGFSNSAFLFSPQGDIVGKYNKIRLLPFNEYIPLRGLIKWPSWFVSSDSTDYRPGEALTVFNMGKAKFGVQICWENLFPDQFRMIASDEAGFIASLTNEKFTDIPYAHYQMLAMNVFRAIENNISIVRVSTTGVSCVIDPDGLVSARVRDRHLQDVNVEGYEVTDVRLSSERSFYNRYGDWFIYLLLVLFLSLLLDAAIRQRRRIEHP